jgi:hypothetical protein
VDETYDEFVQDYEDRVDDLRRSDWRNFARALTDWLQLLDSSSHSSGIIRQLGQRVDFDSWFGAAQTTVRGMVGSGRLDWSMDRTERLAQQLGLVRWLAAGDSNIGQYSTAFSWAGSNLNDNKRKITDELIEPFARDLLRHINRIRKSAPSIPAADRIVPLNHNSAELQDLEVKLGEIETAMERSNSLKQDPDFDRNLAELNAGRRLLSASSLRPSALAALLPNALRWLGEKLAENALTIVITAVAVLLAQLFGITIPGLG